MRENKTVTILGVIYTVLGGILLAVCAVMWSMGITWVAWLTPGIVGAVFFSIGAGIAAVRAVRRRRISSLVEHGEAVAAQIIDVRPNPHVTINDRCVYQVWCKYSEDGVDYVCRSGNMEFVPELISDTVTVYCDPHDRRRYYVDVDSAARPTVVL